MSLTDTFDKHGTFSFPRLGSLLRNVAGWSSGWCSVGRGSSL